MSNKNFAITLQGITFPNFGTDNSKKNFRLMVDIDYFNPSNTPATANITFPVSDDWQWRDEKKSHFLPSKNVTNTTVELDLTVMDKNIGDFSETDREIFVGQGSLHKVSVHIMDVEDKTFADKLKNILNKTLPILVDAATGGIVKAIGNKIIGQVIGQFKGDDITTQILSQIGGKDKILFRGGRLHDTFGNIKIEGTGVFKKKGDGKGNYSVVLGYADITPKQ